MSFKRVICVVAANREAPLYTNTRAACENLANSGFIPFEIKLAKNCSVLHAVKNGRPYKPLLLIDDNYLETLDSNHKDAIRNATMAPCWKRHSHFRQPTDIAVQNKIEQLLTNNGQHRFVDTPYLRIDKITGRVYYTENADKSHERELDPDGKILEASHRMLLVEIGKSQLTDMPAIIQNEDEIERTYDPSIKSAQMNSLKRIAPIFRSAGKGLSYIPDCSKIAAKLSERLLVAGADLTVTQGIGTGGLRIRKLSVTTAPGLAPMH